MTAGSLPVDIFSVDNVSLQKMNQRSLKVKSGLTKRAPDAGESAAISSSFLRLTIFLVGRLRRPRPSAGNANRWAFPCKTIVFVKYYWKVYAENSYVS
jgi:hypothetical protein